MILKKIILENIRSYKKIEIDFSFGSTLLSGDIGSGKTSVLLAIEFALFGLQPGQRGNSLLRNGEKEGNVKIEFEIDGKNIFIERTLKKGKTISQDYCAITIDGDKRETSVTELKNVVLDLLNYPLEFSKKQNLLYKFTVYTPQEEMKQIILQDSATRINIIRRVFGIDRYNRILENSSIIISRLREEKRKKEGITETLEQDKSDFIAKKIELEAKQQNLFSVQKELFVKTENLKKIQEEREEIGKKIEERKKFEKEIEKAEIMIANKKELISNNNRFIKDIKNQIEELKSIPFDKFLIDQIERELISRKDEKEELNQKLLEISSRINSLNLKKEENKKLEQKISNLDVCPTCLQNVDPVYRANVLNKIHNDIFSNNTIIQEFEGEKAEIFNEIRKINLEISSKENKLNDLKIFKIKLQGVQEKEGRLIEIEKSNELFEKDLVLLDKHIQSLRQYAADLSSFEFVFQEKQKEFEEASKQERFVEIKVAELKKEIDVFSKHIEELEERLMRIQEIKKQLNYIMELESWLSKDFSSLISYIEKNVMIKLKKDFSELFSKWFAMLVSDTFLIQLDDNFTPIIEQQDYEIEYNYLSGGERTAIALAYRLALNQVINSFLSRIKTKDLVILDEPTDGFSEQQLDKMRDVLQQLNVDQLILVSHEQKVEDFVEHVLKFKKEGGVSFLD